MKLLEPTFFFLLMAVELFYELFVEMSFRFHCLNKDKLAMLMEIIVYP